MVGTDVYALGIVTYEMLVGRVPFDDGDDETTAVSRLHRTPARLRSVLRTIPTELDDVVMRALARRPEDLVRVCGRRFERISSQRPAATSSGLVARSTTRR